MSSESENFERFRKHLAESEHGVQFAAQYLLSLGHDVLIKATHCAPSRDQWKEFADDGDLYIQQRIEVKHLSATFGKDHWPFGSKFLVCAKHSYDRSKPKPFAYLYFSSDKKCVASVMGTTREHWYVEQRTDKRYENYSQDFYLCPLEYVKFTQIS